MVQRAFSRCVQVMDSIPVLISYINSRECLEYGNNSFQSWTGLSTERILKSKLSDILSEKEYKERNIYIRKVLLGEKVNFKGLLQGQSSEARVFESTYIPDQNENGEVVGFFSTEVDVSREKNLEQLYQEIDRLNSLLSVASHELKTPLTSLKLQLQLRIRKLVKNSHGFFSSTTLESIFREDALKIERLARYVDNLLDCSRINSGKSVLRLEHVDLPQLVSDVLLSLANYQEHSKCKVRLDFKDKVIGRWDYLKIEQICTNLLTNAFRYGAGKHIDIVVSRSENFGILEVRDEGIGIDVNDQVRIFERFERGVNSTEIHGLGLGLYIVKEIVHLHRGKISVASESGKGATFTVELPLQGL